MNSKFLCRIKHSFLRLRLSTKSLLHSKIFLNNLYNHALTMARRIILNLRILCFIPERMIHSVFFNTFFFFLVLNNPYPYVAKAYYFYYYYILLLLLLLLLFLLLLLLSIPRLLLLLLLMLLLLLFTS